MQKISPFLWFNGQAEAAARFYVSVFRNAEILHTTYYSEGLPFPAGTVLTVQFVLDGETFTALNGGPEYAFTPAVSFSVSCETQEEIDELWSKLTDGGQEVQCGWLVDRFGVSWQIVPKGLDRIFNSKDPAASQRALQAMLGMKKLDLPALKRAYGPGWVE